MPLQRAPRWRRPARPRRPTEPRTVHTGSRAFAARRLRTAPARRGTRPAEAAGRLSPAAKRGAERARSNEGNQPSATSCKSASCAVRVM
jgi:hypothetical protein